MRGVIERAAPEVRVDVVPDACQALAGLLPAVADGALVAIFYEHLEEVVELLESVGARQVDALPLDGVSEGQGRYTRRLPLSAWKASAGPS